MFKKSNNLRAGVHSTKIVFLGEFILGLSNLITD